MRTSSRPEGSQAGVSTHRTAPDGISRWAKLVVPLLIALALGLRLAYYLLNPSLSTDEAQLALNIMHRPYGDLFEELDFNQAAPPGFLLLQKLAVDVFGASPYALRLLPFLAGALACLLVYPVSTRIAGRSAAVLALALFAISFPLVSYASTNKQYSSDVAVALGLFALMFAIQHRFRWRQALLLALLGGIALFVSHPAAFVLAAIWLVFVARNVQARNWRQVVGLAVLAAVWLSCLAAAYLLTQASVEQIQRTAGSGWGSSLQAVMQTIGGIARYLLGVPGFAPEMRAAITCIAIVLCLVGLRAVLPRNPGATALIVVPAVVAAVAVSIQFYPPFGRTFLFMQPPLIILIGSGTAVLLARQGPRPLRIGAGVALSVLLGVGAFETLRHLRPDVATEPTRALSYLVEHTRRGDSLYVSRPAQYTFRYYLECGCFANARTVTKGRELWPTRPTAGHGQFDAALESSPPSFIAGSSIGLSERDYARDFPPLLGRRRVWVLLFDPNPDAKKAMAAFLQRHGRLLDAFPPQEGNAVASVLLYNLRPQER